MDKVILFAGSSNLPLVTEIAKYLNIQYSSVKIKIFTGREIFIEIVDEVKDKDVYLLQAISSPVNDNIMELLISIDTLKRAAARNIMAIIPYLGYARQDRQHAPKTSVAAELVARMLSNIGLTKIITVDLHSALILDFFTIPVNNIYPTELICQDIEQFNYKQWSIIAPDLGSLTRAQAIVAKYSNTELIVMDKIRNGSSISYFKPFKTYSVVNKNCIIIDDIIDSANTICEVVRQLKIHGAASLRAYVTHAVLAPAAVDKIVASPLEELVVTNTIPLSHIARLSNKIRQISIAKVLANTLSVW